MERRRCSRAGSPCAPAHGCCGPTSSRRSGCSAWPPRWASEARSSTWARLSSGHGRFKPPCRSRQGSDLLRNRFTRHVGAWRRRCLLGAASSSRCPSLRCSPACWLLDVLLIAFGSLCAAGLLRLAASEPVDRVDGPAWRLGGTEALVVLAILDAVFAAFAIAQVLAATGAAADTLRSAGVIYADYARSGFFQLLWVSGITLAVLFLFSRISRLSRRRNALAFMVLAESAIALTLMVDVVAFRRLSLYEEAYGFTMLRLYSHVFAVWVAVVFLLLAVDFLGLWSRRRWFVGATIASALIVLLGLNFINPEALVVAFNTNHAQIAHKIDGEYLTQLSSDATPALLASRASLDQALRSQVDHAGCSGQRTYSAPPAAFNWSDAQAAAARRTGC
ncbi:MAG: DUF4173 domain-containing protein [Chloroflexi bacterium]|nr:MAG: DUF4173 domain-containing protein [Chloroflexota bacterium]